MEYLKSIDDTLNTIDEKNIHYINILCFSEYIFGNLPSSSREVDFCKFPPNIQFAMRKYGSEAVREMNNLNSSACGNRLRLQTTSKRIIFKVQLKRKFGYEKMINLNAMGFDVYSLNNEKYVHKVVFAPSDGNNIFAEEITVLENEKLCIFLPNYNVIQKMYIGIEEESEIQPIEYPEDKRLPIVFYGNSVTQGAAASKSGNTFPNFVSKLLNRDIINLSCSSCCRGDESVAELIGKIDCYAIVIDYTRNAFTIDAFRNTHEKFYKTLRKYHPKIKIILLTTANFNHWMAYDEYDKIVLNTYQNAKKHDENTELIFQNKLFDEKEYQYVAIDSSHYTDYGMFKIANEICKIINEE